MSPNSVIFELDVDELLDSASTGQRAAYFKAVPHLAPPDAAKSTSDYGWIWAEWAYSRGRHADAIPEFEAWLARESDATGEKVERMRLGAQLRLARCCYRVGRSIAAAGYMKQVLAATWDDRFARFRPAAEAMAAHLIELEGSSELARTRYMYAYSQACKVANHRVACTTAADISRLLLELGRPGDAYDWLERAFRHHEDRPFEYDLRTLLLRRAKLDRLMLRTEAAEAGLRELLRACEDECTPIVEIGALTALHEIELAREGLSSKARFDAAKKHLDAAIEIAGSRCLLPSLIHLHRDLARLHFTAHDGYPDSEAARASFDEALRLTFEMSPRPRLVLLQLAEDVRNHSRGLLPVYLPDRAGYLARLKVARKEMRRALRPRAHGQTDRRNHRDRAAAKLEAKLRVLRPRTVFLDGCSFVFSDKVVAYCSLDENRALQDGEVKILEALLRERGTPILKHDLSEKADTTVGCVEGFFKLLRRMACGRVSPAEDGSRSTGDVGEDHPILRRTGKKGSYKFELVVREIRESCWP